MRLNGTSEVVCRIGFVSDSYVRLYDIASIFVRHSDDTRIGDSVVFRDRVLDLLQTDTVARLNDHVVLPTDEVEVPVRRFNREILREHPIIMELGHRFL